MENDEMKAYEKELSRTNLPEHSGRTWKRRTKRGFCSQWLIKCTYVDTAFEKV
jgi:hypothetical protein